MNWVRRTLVWACEDYANDPLRGRVRHELLIGAHVRTTREKERESDPVHEQEGEETQ